ncbi:hypothetical protein SAMN05444695_10728 [Rhodococcus triatomae]|uniref:Iron reductase n=1 Tax=Rhodococcus triatomae TaxID=300028 RepID=A0A1G8K724_9NOCA|nr:hypothetical protein SAMN05444695_10728 [Rhodococcus triatomae]
MTATLLAPATVLDRSLSRMRELHPDYPRMYAVATMAGEGKRRWWALGGAQRASRISLMLDRAVDDLGDPDAAALQVASSLIHAVVGRVTALTALEGRAWDCGVENLWIHMDNDGCIDWAGIVDETLRVLPGDPAAGTPGTVTVPCERALHLWTASRCMSSLSAVATSLSRCSSIDRRRYWGLVGESVLGAATHVPLLAGIGGADAQRRGQGLLDAFVASGAPVRSRVRPWVRPGRAPHGAVLRNR